MVSVCYRIHCGDNRISMACCKTCKHFLVPRTIFLTSNLCFSGTSANQENTCDSAKNFSQDTRFCLFKEWNRCLNRQCLVSLQSICVLKCFTDRLHFSANVRNSQKSFPYPQIPTAQQYIFNLMKPLSQIPAKSENLNQNLNTVDENKKTQMLLQEVFTMKNLY